MTGEKISSRRTRSLSGVLVVVAAVVGALVLAACGGSGNSGGGGNTGGGGGNAGGGSSGKPSYCAKIDDLQRSVSDLASVKVIEHGTSSVRASVDRVKNNADAAVAALRSDFQSETSALSRSIDNLSHSVNQLSSSPLSAVTAIPGQVSALHTAVTNLVDSARSKCG